MASDLIGELERLGEAGREAIARAASVGELESVRIELLGRKEGRLTGVLRRLGELEPAQRAPVGAAANELKADLTSRLDARAAELERVVGAGEAGPDLTLPGRAAWRGAYHPVTLVIDEICDIFATLGFSRVRGPEAETEWHNFVALNTPLDHPAADMQDTFYLEGGGLLRSHTSPVQVRTMQAHEPPIRVVVPGMVYRRDPFDPSHAPAFAQIEGLAVDEGVTMVDLKATLAEFARRFFGRSAEVRFRPSFFPFTEPSAEVDVSCTICSRAGCPTCKGTGWLEIMGAGMVDPNVFEQVGYDPERYTGFAFGMGPGRVAMLRHGVPDLRILYESDVRFLSQFAGVRP